MQKEGIIAAGQVVPLVFTQGAVAASQTNVQIGLADGVADVLGLTMPFAGSIVALSYNLDAAGTAGSFTIGATINGTENASTTQTVGTTTEGRALFKRDLVRFAAGDELGVEITTDGSWDGTTSDLAVVLWVLLEVGGI